MYTVLTGAKINMGDFLIEERCTALLKKHLPEEELFVLPHFEPLDTHLEKINSGKAIIIMGGPGFQPSFYPGVYKLTGDLNRIRVPIVPMGLGWKGVPGDFNTLRNYRFTPSSMTVLKRISAETKYLGCRDYLTCEALRRNGIENPLMIGCPVWYRIDAIGKSPVRPREVTSLAVTPAQRSIYQKQSIELLREISNMFPTAARYCSFNRGISQDHPLLPPADRRNNAAISDAAESLGYEVVDTSFGTDKIGFYEECDIHVGYRVHTHLHFLSSRKPSILLHEDGRGRGVSEALNVLGVDAFRAGRMGILRKIRPSKYAVEQVKTYLLSELENGFSRFAGFGKIIDEQYEIMKQFIRSLPEA